MQLFIAIIVSLLTRFIRRTRKKEQVGIITEFDGALWDSMVEFVTIGKECRSDTFKDGTKYRYNRSKIEKSTRFWNFSKSRVLFRRLIEICCFIWYYQTNFTLSTTVSH